MTQFKPSGLHQGSLSLGDSEYLSCQKVSEQLTPTNPCPLACHDSSPSPWAATFIFHTLSNSRKHMELPRTFSPLSALLTPGSCFYKFLELSTHPLKEVRNLSPLLCGFSITAWFSQGPLSWPLRSEGRNHHLSLSPLVPLQVTLERPAPQRSSSLHFHSLKGEGGLRTSFAPFQ